MRQEAIPPFLWIDNTMKQNIRKLILLNFIIIATMVICYSEGFLHLRPQDESILRAGMSIFMGIAGVFAFFYGNYKILNSPSHKLYTPETLLDLSHARSLLSSFHGGKYFGRLADTAVKQMARLERTMDRTDQSIALKFEPGSMAYDRYYSTIHTARQTAIRNCVKMANRMQLFNEKEYAQLEHYKEDDIPDDIQEKQIALYQKNIQQVKESIAANENLILALDTMSLELAASEQADNKKNDALLSEIEKLTDQVKLYL